MRSPMPVRANSTPTRSAARSGGAMVSQSTCSKVPPSASSIRSCRRASRTSSCCRSRDTARIRCDLSQALAGRLRAGGAALMQASARAFEVVAGRVARVVVDDGALAVDAVVVAAGVHANGLSSQLGSRVPLTSERGYHVMLEAPGAVPRIPVMSGAGKYFLTPMEGGLRVAGAVELASVDAAPDWRRADVLLAGARTLIPALTHGAVGRWMGHRPSLPDSLPVIARSPRFANAYFAFGHGHVGLTGAAPTAMLIADLVAGRAPAIDLGPYAIDRF